MSIDYVEDTIAYPVSVGLLGQAAATLAERGLADELCFSGIVPGVEYALDHCQGECEGALWVRVAALFPSTAFPQQDATVPPNGALNVAQQYEVGLVRGFALPDNAEPLDELASLAIARRQLADASALAAAICGYFSSEQIRFLLGQYTPIGPIGGCVGGSWIVTAERAF